MPAPLSVSDELASLAMQCALSERLPPRDQTHPCFHPAELWSPLVSQDTTATNGRRGARPEWLFADGGRAEADEHSPDSSFTEPSLKRDASAHTQLVRRAVSFVLTDVLDDASSATLMRSERATPSPHTAIAA